MTAWVPSALAADPPTKSPNDVAAIGTWTGFYAGVHGGMGWGTSRFDDPTVPTAFNNIEASSNGPLAGGQIGANLQRGNFVYGVELDGSWALVRGNASRTVPTVIAASSQLTKFRALATATARLGYTQGPWLVYGKVGGAWADVKITARFTPDLTEYGQSWYGVATGTGVEVAFMRNVSAKVEYNFLYFPIEEMLWSNPTTPTSIDHYIHVVKAGINVRFGGAPLPVR